MNPQIFSNYIAPLLSSACQIAGSIPTSERGIFWYFVGLLGFWGWAAVIIVFLIWGTTELTLRFGSSANRCSPAFNSAVGSLTFTVFQSLVYLLFGVFSKLFGSWVYCTIWPNLSYLIVFPAVWFFLVGIGFWVY
jgi:hypothetical protein